ncbi:MAG: ATP-binding cassette domain-containing protein [Anaerolineae bacterium]
MRVELLNITKRFGELSANQDVSATFEPGEVHGLLGENGAGKSTLMKVLAGWYVPEGGTIRLDGKDVLFHSPQEALAHGIGYVPQDPQDFPPLTVLEHLVVGTPGWAVRRDALVKDLERVNQNLGFDLKPSTRIQDLTIGQRLQLAMAQVVVYGAKVIILDEPPMGSGLRDSLQKLAAEGRTVVFITHNIPDAVTLCNRISVLRRGRRVGAVEQPVNQGVLVKLMFEEDLPAAGEPPSGSEAIAVDLNAANSRTDPPLANINLKVHAGEIVGLAGIEGSGQAPLLSVLAGRDRLTSGARTCNARRVHLVPAGRLGEGLVDGFNVEEMLALAHPDDVRQGWRLDPGRMVRLAERAISQFYIKGQARSPAGSLSGGNQQRLMLACVPFDTDLLLLDNPTRGLDVPTAGFIWTWIMEQCQRGAAVVVASNELEELWSHASRIVVLERGRIAGEVTPVGGSFARLKQLVGGAKGEGE